MVKAMELLGLVQVNSGINIDTVGLDIYLVPRMEMIFVQKVSLPHLGLLFCERIMY